MKERKGAELDAHKFYKPAATRAPVLGALFITTLLLISLLEYACHVIPAHNGFGSIGEVMDQHMNFTGGKNLERRSNLSSDPPSSIASSVSGLISTSSVGTVSIPSPATLSSTTSPQVTSTTTGGWLTLGPDTSTPPPVVNAPPANTPSVNTPPAVNTPPVVSNPPAISVSPVVTPSIVPIITTATAPGSWYLGVGAAPTTAVTLTTDGSAYLNIGDNSPTTQPNPPAGVQSTIDGSPAKQSLPSPPSIIPGYLTQSNDGGSVVIVSIPPSTAPVYVTQIIVGGNTVESTIPASTIPASVVPQYITQVTTNGVTLESTVPASTIPESIASEYIIQTVVDGTTTSSTILAPTLPPQATTGLEIISAYETSILVSGKTIITSISASTLDLITPLSTPASTVIVVSTGLVTSDGQVSAFTSTYASIIYVNAPSSICSGQCITPTHIATAPHVTATIVNSNGTFLLMSDGSVEIPPQITLKQYVIVSFIPLILAIIFTIPWRIIDNTIRNMEPIYQLYKGSNAEDSLCLDYSTRTLLTRPIRSLSRGHMLVFWSSMISLSTLLITPLASEFIFVSLSGQCGNGSTSCHATWGIYPSLARMIEGILAFIALLVLLLLIFGFYRRSGVYAEPLSIAGLATLFYSSPLLISWREIDSTVRNSELRGLLTGRSFQLSRFIDGDRTVCYGIVPANQKSEAGFGPGIQTGTKGKYNALLTADPHTDGPLIRRINNHPSRVAALWQSLKARLFYIAAFFLLAGLFIVICYYHWTGGNTGFNIFFDSQGFGVRFLMAALGVIVNMFWSNIDEDLRRTEPYHRLLQGRAKPEDSILVPYYMSPVTALIPLIRRRQILPALVAIVSILAEFLPITLVNTPFSPTTTLAAYTACTFIAISILILMLLTITCLIFRPRHNVKQLPRKPGTTASALLYITNSGEEGWNMLGSLKSLSVVDEKERDARIRGLGKVYTMGVVRDGELRIDEDENIWREWTSNPTIHGSA